MAYPGESETRIPSRQPLVDTCQTCKTYFETRLQSPFYLTEYFSGFIFNIKYIIRTLSAKLPLSIVFNSHHFALLLAELPRN